MTFVGTDESTRFLMSKIRGFCDSVNLRRAAKTRESASFHRVGTMLSTVTPPTLAAGGFEGEGVSASFLASNEKTTQRAYSISTRSVLSRCQKRFVIMSPNFIYV